MASKIFSASFFGFECRLVEVEVDILNGLSSIIIVGLGDASVQESKERIRSAIKNSGAEYPRRKKTINLAPADLRKHGPMFDLPIALGLLLQSEQIPAASLDSVLAVGELALSGELRRIPGVLPIVAFAKKQNFHTVIVPYENAKEAAVVSDIKIIAANNIMELMAHLRGQSAIEPYENSGVSENEYIQSVWNFEDIRGQEYAKRSLMIAAAGFHHVLLFGPPGSGKTMLARSFPSILPPLNFEEAVEVTKIYSIAGKLSPELSLMHAPPFRAIHHTASTMSLVGGGAIPRPGEISLAHNGVLFLDELLEFSRGTLDSLRQPLEDGVVSVTRVAGSSIFPARFVLLAATNPCPCGYFGDRIKACVCLPTQRQQYAKKLSGPLLDRIDLMCSVPRLPFEKISALPASSRSEIIRKQVMAARARQQERQCMPNGLMGTRDIRQYCHLSAESLKLLQEAFAKFHCSGRSYYRIIKVARTIADLDGAAEIAPHHLAEALQYRPRAETLSENV